MKKLITLGLVISGISLGFAQETEPKQQKEETKKECCKTNEKGEKEKCCKTKNQKKEGKKSCCSTKKK